MLNKSKPSSFEKSEFVAHKLMKHFMRVQPSSKSGSLHDNIIEFRIGGVEKNGRAPEKLPNGLSHNKSFECRGGSLTKDLWKPIFLKMTKRS